MLIYFQSTFLILLWALVLSLIWALFIYEILCFKEKTIFLYSTDTKYHDISFLLPSIVYASFIIVFAYKILGINLIFPIHFLTNFQTLIVKSFIPAVILLLSSGILFKIYFHIIQEFNFWKSKNFAVTYRILGFSYHKILFTLVLVQSFFKSWSQSLVWLFSELIVIEALFNVPGLGQNLIYTAKIRNIEGFLTNLSYILLIYVALYLSSLTVNYYIGKKLQSYA